MRRGIIFGIMLILLFMGMLALAFDVQPVKAELGTIYIRADGSIDPPTVPISTIDNVTYTLTGNVTSDADGIAVERSNIKIDGNGYTLQGTKSGTGIVLAGRSNVIIKNTNIKGFGQCGIYLNSTSYSFAFGNNITNNGDGFDLRFSSNNSIFGNNITNNNGNGVVFAEPSNNNTISNNIVTDNRWYGLYILDSYNNMVSGNTIMNNYAGVTLARAHNNTITGNTVINNYEEGVYFYNSSHNSLSGNNIKSNTHFGVVFRNFSDNNTISGNNITNNNDIGVYLFDSPCANEFCHNNFIDNTQQAYEPSGYASVWDDGYPSGGNYWSDYNGVDLYSGPYQNETGSDEVGDTFYIINENNTDRYPLMESWTQKFLKTDLNKDGTVNIMDIAIVAQAYGAKYNETDGIFWHDSRCKRCPHTSSANLDGNKEINIIDIATVAKDYGKTA